jgi:hypothetical protein
MIDRMMFVPVAKVGFFAFAISQHFWLGSNSLLAKLDRELIIIIVRFLW